MKAALLAVLGLLSAGAVLLVLLVVVIVAPNSEPAVLPKPAVACVPARTLGDGIVQAVDGAGPAAGGLNEVQTRNARVTVGVAQQLGVPEAGMVVAVMVGMQESGMKNLASRANPGSLDFPHDGVAKGDHDSVGIVQQRDAWGSLAARMDVAKSMGMFFQGGAGGQRGLLGIKGWEAMPRWKASQTVQVSAYPTAYAKWETLATTSVAAILAEGGGGVAALRASLPAPVQCAPETAEGEGEFVQAAVGVTGPWTRPMQGSYTKSSPYGWRMHPTAGVRRLHAGTDLSTGGAGTIVAASAGVVKQSPNGTAGSYGNLTTIDHGGGLETRYAHAARFLVPDGTRVAAGTPIAVEGATGGNSTGRHLHFEVRLNGASVDPVPFMVEHGAAL